MATKYELPEEVNEERLRTFGMEVEMKTFKTNVTCDGHRGIIKIICTGDTSPHRKSMFINDYCQIYRTEEEFWRPLIGIDIHLKKIKTQRSEAERRLLFIETAEHPSFLRMSEPYLKALKGSHGAVALWRTCNPTSLEIAAIWMQGIRKKLPSIPCVLVTDNTGYGGQEALQWIGPGKIFESDEALDQFCKDHGFVDHFEIKARDWTSGEKSVFGRAVNCLLDKIFQNEQKEANVIR